MTRTNTTRPGTIAPLKNVSSFLALVDTLQTRPAHADGLGVFSGYSGYGKSMAAQYAWNKTGALYIQIFESWNRRAFTEALLKELGANKPRGTVATMMSEIVLRLGDNPDRPIIIDEADKLVDKKMIELVREIHESTRCPVVLVGEELLPKRLEQYERVHNRVLDFVLAQPCDLADARALARCLYPKLSISDALLDRIRMLTQGRARRICTTLHEAATFAANAGLPSLDIDNYRGRIFTGESPRRHARAA